VRAGLDGGRIYTVTDLWSGATTTARRTLGVALDGNAANLLQLDQHCRRAASARSRSTSEPRPGSPVDCA
jgi:hypothetical protein